MDCGTNISQSIDHAGACIFLLGSAMQTGASSVATLVVGRFIGGIGVGMLSMVVPMYIAEVAPPEIRGTLLVLEEFPLISVSLLHFG